MPADAFVDKLNEQIAYEFAASQQYVAVAVHYEAQTLPRLAGFFYERKEDLVEMCVRAMRCASG